MKVRISVRGQSYTVRSDEDDIDLREVARYVDQQMNEVAGRGALDDYTVAMMAALNIASDLRRLQRVVDEELVAIDREIAGALVLVEASMPFDEEEGSVEDEGEGA